MTDSSVSTRVASELLSVHESSIKRWCNAGDLDFWTTPGGHRRIPISKLVAFARQKGLDGEITHFDGSAERVWVGLEESKRNENFNILSKLVLEWINLGRIDLVERLVLFMMHQDVSLGEVFDEVVADAMTRVGSGYTSRQLTIGDEHRLTSLIRDALLGIRRMVTADRTQDSTAKETAIVGCIRGELHEIGALMVRLVLLHAGWNVVYLGQDVPTEEYHAQAMKHDAALICISMAPPRGGTEAADAIQLLARLFTNGSSTRLAFGGTTLSQLPDATGLDDFAEVKFFTRATPFQSWLQEISR